MDSGGPSVMIFGEWLMPALFADSLDTQELVRLFLHISHVATLYIDCSYAYFFASYLHEITIYDGNCTSLQVKLHAVLDLDRA